MGDSEDRLNDWARLVRKVRLAHGLTQEQLADLVKVSRATIGRWETGDTFAPSAPTMRLFASATDTDYEVVAQAVLGAQRRRHDDDDDAMRIVETSNLTEDHKREIIDYILKHRAESEDSIRRAVDLFLRNGRREAS